MNAYEGKEEEEEESTIATVFFSISSSCSFIKQKWPGRKQILIYRYWPLSLFDRHA